MTTVRYSHQPDKLSPQPMRVQLRFRSGQRVLFCVGDETGLWLKEQFGKKFSLSTGDVATKLVLKVPREQLVILWSSGPVLVWVMSLGFRLQTGDGQEILDTDIIGQGLLSQDAPIIGTMPSEDEEIATEGSLVEIDAEREALRLERPGQGVCPLKLDAVIRDGVHESKAEDGFVLRYRNSDGSMRTVPNLSPASTWWTVCTEILHQEERLRGIHASADAGKLSVVLFAWCGQPLLPTPSAYLQTLADFGVTSGECVHALLVPSADDAAVASCVSGLDPDLGSASICIHSSSGAKYVVKVNLATDSVLALKQKLFTKEHIPIPAQKLVYNGKILDNVNVGAPGRTACAVQVPNSNACVLPVVPHQTRLGEVGVTEDAVIKLTLGFREHAGSGSGWRGNFSAKHTPCTVPQTSLGQSQFFSCLYTVADSLSLSAPGAHKVLTVLRELTCNLPLVTALRCLIAKVGLPGLLVGPGVCVDVNRCVDRRY
jgi:hypothetical protein